MEYQREIRVISRRYAKEMKPVCAQFHLSQIELAVLVFLSDHPNCNTVRDIAQDSGFTKSHVSTAIQGLLHRDYVTRTSAPNNDKVQIITVTPEALQVLQVVKAVRNRFEATLFDGFSVEERTLCRSFLHRISHNLATGRTE